MLTEKVFDTGTVKLNYVEGPAGGLPLVLLHGLTLRWQAFLPVIPTLAFRYHIYGVDLRGHGLSGRMTDAYRIEDYAADIIRFLKQQVAEPAILLGHSLGAMVAVCVAAQVSDKLHAILLEDPPFYAVPPKGHFSEHPHYPIYVGWRDLVQSKQTTEEILPGLASLHPEMDTVGLRFWAKCFSLLDPDTLTQIINERTYETYDLNVLLPQIICPVLLLQGDPALGGLLNDENVERALRLLRNGTHLRMNGVGHMLHDEKTKAFCDFVTGFLESL